MSKTTMRVFQKEFSLLVVQKHFPGSFQNLMFFFKGKVYAPLGVTSSELSADADDRSWKNRTHRKIINEQ